MPSRRFFLQALLLGACARKAHPRRGEEWMAGEGVRKPEDPGIANELLAEAERYIGTQRKRNYTLRFTKQGQPLTPGTSITLAPLRSAFDWGFAGSSTLALDAKNPRKLERSKRIAEVFNTTTAKCYWDEHWHQPIEQHRGHRIYDQFLGEVEWAEQMGLKPKGHPLIWTVPKAVPLWAQRLNNKDRRAAMEMHVRSMVGLVGDRVLLWDLANEFLWEPIPEHIPHRKWPQLESIQDIVGYLKPALMWARETNPNALFSLNDYGLERTYRPEVTAKRQRERYVQLIKAMADAGAMPDALGTQAHVGAPYNCGELVTMLNELALAGLPIHITEFMIANPTPVPDERQAEYVSKMLTLAYGHPYVEHFTVWPSENDLFLPGTAEPNLNYKAIKQLIKESWATKPQPIQVNSQSEAQVWAGKGDYKFILKQDSGTTEGSLTLKTDLKGNLNFG